MVRRSVVVKTMNNRHKTCLILVNAILNIINIKIILILAIFVSSFTTTK